MKKLLIFLLLIFIVLPIIACLVIVNMYNNSLKPISSKSEEIKIEIEKNNTYYSIASLLKEKNLIKSEFFYTIYIKLNKPTSLKAGTYILNKNMGVKEIINVLKKGGHSSAETFNITFREGLNMREIANLISNNSDNKEEDVFNALNDKNYIDTLINNYWFLTDEIKNKDIYYPLEGYLYPNTYQFLKNATVKDIFKTMLDETDTKLKKYKTEIEKNKYSVHELITLASIIELEAGNSHERSKVAGVFYNRLNSGWTLGSDVTTYYAAKKSFKEDLTYDELKACNAYNTRGTCVKGLPVGPICNPSIESIEGAVNPTSSNYYYFVADKNGKTYFNTDSYGHQSTIADLKNKNLWYVYN